MVLDSSLTEDLDEDRVLKGVKGQWKPAREVRWHRCCQLPYTLAGHCFGNWISGGYDIKRSDGQTATIQMENRRFQFFVFP
uniref:FBA_2 domain-containing protein n=1 Tax=Caenorhabditis tropicalis TaxID=1561998 RepID=A0A1I7T6A5_9PELO